MKITKGHKMDEFEKQTKSFTLAFKIKPLGVVQGVSNVMRITEDSVLKRDGSRNPAMFFTRRTTVLEIFSNVNSSRNHIFLACQIALPLNVFTELKITEVHINGTICETTINTNPRTIDNATIFFSDRWYNAANAVFKDYQYQQNEQQNEQQSQLNQPSQLS